MQPAEKGPRRRNLRQVSRGIPKGRHEDRRLRDTQRRWKSAENATPEEVERIIAGERIPLADDDYDYDYDLYDDYPHTTVTHSYPKYYAVPTTFDRR